MIDKKDSLSVRYVQICGLVLMRNDYKLYIMNCLLLRNYNCNYNYDYNCASSYDSNCDYDFDSNYDCDYDCNYDSNYYMIMTAIVIVL